MQLLLLKINALFVVTTIFDSEFHKIASKFKIVYQDEAIKSTQR